MKSRLPLSPRRSLVLHLLLVLSLLLAQSAAYAHVSGHLKVGGPDTSGMAGKPATQFCGECLEGAALLGAAGAPHVPSILQAPAAVAAIPALVCTPFEHRSHYAFRSRAPPLPL